LDFEFYFNKQKDRKSRWFGGQSGLHSLKVGTLYSLSSQAESLGRSNCGSGH